MNLERKKVKLSDKEVKKIYVDSFSKEERMPFALMLLLTKITRTEFLAFYDENILCGFIYMAAVSNITFIMFFAVDKRLHSKGYGSQILKEVQTIYPDNKIIVTIERCDVEAENIKDRIRRKNFYIKNGFTETGYFTELSKIEQEIIIRNGDFSSEEFSNFLREYSNGAMKAKIWKK